MSFSSNLVKQSWDLYLIKFTYFSNDYVFKGNIIRLFSRVSPLYFKSLPSRDTVLNMVCENRLNDQAIAKGRKTAHYVSNNILAFYANTLHNRVKCLIDGSLKHFSTLFQIQISTIRKIYVLSLFTDALLNA